MLLPFLKFFQESGSKHYHPHIKHTQCGVSFKIAYHIWPIFSSAAGINIANMVKLVIFASDIFGVIFMLYCEQ